VCSRHVFQVDNAAVKHSPFAVAVTPAAAAGNSCVLLDASALNSSETSKSTSFVVQLADVVRAC
jgi:hypothetical protein